MKRTFQQHRLRLISVLMTFMPCIVVMSTHCLSSFEAYITTAIRALINRYPSSRLFHHQRQILGFLASAAIIRSPHSRMYRTWETRSKHWSKCLCCHEALPHRIRRPIYAQACILGEASHEDRNPPMHHNDHLPHRLRYGMRKALRLMIVGLDFDNDAIGDGKPSTGLSSSSTTRDVKLYTKSYS